MDSSVKIEFLGISDSNIDLVSGLLSGFPVNGLEEVENGVNAFFLQKDWNEDLEIQLREIAKSLGGSISLSIIPFENWNKTWESGYEPVEIDSICRIYAPFHGEPGRAFENEIEIIPQMAFGTGHHETTEMMIRLMYGIRDKIKDNKVLDFGAGSGILAIYAHLLEAESISANEIDRYAFENLKENTNNNNAKKIRVFCGGSTVLPEGEKYDVILANITRNVILDHLEFFKNRLLPKGRILVSGILDKDREEMEKQFQQFGLENSRYMNLGKWCAMILE